MIRKSRISRALIITAVAGAMVALGTASTLAVPAFVDFNDFALGSPNGQFGGTGFEAASPWIGSAVVSVIPGDLSSDKYELSQSGDGRSIQGNFSAVRHTTRALATPLSGEVWFSFLLNLPDATSRGGIVFNPTASNGTTNPYSVFLLGPQTLRATVGQSSGNNKDAAVNATLGQTVLIVGQLDTNAQTLKAWFDPDLVANPDILSHTPQLSVELSVPIESITSVGPMSWNTASTTATPVVGGIVDHVRVSNSYNAFLDIPPDVHVAIDRETGNVTLTSNTAITIAGYTLSSALGGLNPNNWKSIANNYDADAPPPGGGTVDPVNSWSILGTPNANLLTESTLFGLGAPLSQGQTIDLGTGLWKRSPFEDVKLEVLLSDGSVASNVNVNFVGNGGNPYQTGDLDLDGDVDIDDFHNVFLPNYFANTSGLSFVNQYLAGDLDGDGETGFYDFLLFNEAYRAANPGAAALSLSFPAAVPEPATLSLMVLVTLGLTALTRRLRLAQCCLALALVMVSFASPVQANFLINGNFEDVTDWWFAGAGPGTQPVGWRDTTGDNPATQQFDSLAIGGSGISALIQPVAGGRLRQELSTLPLPQAVISFDFATDDPGGANDRTLSGTVLNQNGATLITFRVVDENEDGIGEMQFFSGTWQVGTLPNSVIFGNLGSAPLVHSMSIRLDTARDVPAYDVTLIDSNGTVHEATGLSYFNGTAQPYGRIGGIEFPSFNSVGDWLLDNVAITNGISTNGLSLRVFEDSGQVYLTNDSGAPVAFDAYRVLSDSGALLAGTGNWSSLEDQGIGGTPGNPAWSELGATSFEIAEGHLGGTGSVLNAGASISLGQIYNTSDLSKDLQLEFHVAGAPPIAIFGPVSFVQGLPGDYNDDGIVDAGDYVVWRNNLGAPAGTLANDIDGGTIGAAQYQTWKSFYGASTGGSLLVSAAIVPEPSSLVLLIGLGASLLVGMRK